MSKHETKRVLKPISVLLFDLGKVILDFDYGVAVKRLMHHCDKTPLEIMALFERSYAEGLYETGRISSEEFFERVKAALGLSCDYETFVPIWNEIFSEMPETIALLKEAKSRYRLVLISNTNELHFRYVQGRYPVLNLIDRFILSHEVRSRKPDRAIFDAAIQAAGVGADEIFYTDDHAEFVEAARRLGIRGTPFVGPEALREELARAGVLLNGKNQGRI